MHPLPNVSDAIFAGSCNPATLLNWHGLRQATPESAPC